jgi:hypothetical protein
MDANTQLNLAFWLVFFIFWFAEMFSAVAFLNLAVAEPISAVEKFCSAVAEKNIAVAILSSAVAENIFSLEKFFSANRKMTISRHSL